MMSINLMGVCFSRNCSLREAISIANACPGSRTFNLPAGGNILTIDCDNVDDYQTGDLDIIDDLRIICAGALLITGNIERAFIIHPAIIVSIEGIWLTGGNSILQI